MTPELFLQIAVRPALSLLPPKMDSAEARGLLLAIALQESRLTYRRQINGPAKSYLMFERAGVVGVLQHDASRVAATELCLALDVPPYVASVYPALEFQDVLACGMGRLLLWTLPGSLPGPQEPGPAWDYYLDAWRPGKAHRGTWDAVYAQAWETVLGYPTEGVVQV